MTEDRVVWVIGSGFSKPLGGPLLNELFERHRFDQIAGCLNARLSPNEASHWKTLCSVRLKRVFNIYDVAERNEIRVPWRNAEEYVELISLAAQLGAGRSFALLQRVVNEMEEGRIEGIGDLLELAEDACTYLVAVTHEFVQGADTSTEAWRPYVRWAKALQKQDQVISFNYDLVQELAYKQAFRGAEIARSVPASNVVQMFKPHGSVDWRLTQSVNALPSTGANCEVLHSPDPFKAMAEGHYFAGIGVPGPSKLRSCESTFKAEWEGSCEALQTADTMVFVGYRFPETDNFAKQTLLEAISENRNTHVTIRIVLGPKRDDNVERLEGMLRWALSHRKEARGKPEFAAAPKERKGRASFDEELRESLRLTFRIVHEPMWAQDFLAVFDRDKLHTH